MRVNAVESPYSRILIIIQLLSLRPSVCVVIYVQKIVNVVIVSVSYTVHYDSVQNKLCWNMFFHPGDHVTITHFAKYAIFNMCER